jgi:hypothetical protein
MSHLTRTSSGDATHRLKRDATSLFCNLLIFGATVGALVWMHVDSSAVERPADPPAMAAALEPVSR